MNYSGILTLTNVFRRCYCGVVCLPSGMVLWKEVNFKDITKCKITMHSSLCLTDLHNFIHISDIPCLWTLLAWILTKYMRHFHQRLAELDIDRFSRHDSQLILAFLSFIWTSRLVALLIQFWYITHLYKNMVIFSTLK